MTETALAYADDENDPEATEPSAPKGGSPRGHHVQGEAGVRPPPSMASPPPVDLPERAEHLSSPEAAAPSPADDLILFAADLLNDIEGARTALGNRIGALTRPVEKGGKGQPVTAKEVAALSFLFDQVAATEAHAVRLVVGEMRRHSLHPWVKAQRGLGDKQVARFLATIGDPYIRADTGEPRTVSQLWALCGLHVLHPGQPCADTQWILAGVDSSGGSDRFPSGTHVSSVAAADSAREGHHHVDTHRADALPGNPSDPAGHRVLDAQVPNARGVAPKRRKGARANWSTQAKTRAMLCADSCIKQTCLPCQAKNAAAKKANGGKAAPWSPPPEGCICAEVSPWRSIYDTARMNWLETRPDATDMHAHNHAKRVLAKAIVKGLYRESKRIHTGTAEAEAVT